MIPSTEFPLPDAVLPSAQEAARLQALFDLEVLDTGAEHPFDALTRAAAAVCDVPISLVSLVDAHRQWFKSNHGLEGLAETPRDIAFCAHAIQGGGIFEVPDARADPRFADNPLVTGEPDLRFYAGATLRLSNGAPVGTLCVMDHVPRRLDARQREVLVNLATAAAQALEGRRALQGERALRALADHALTMMRHSPDPIIVLSLDGRVQQWNGAAQQLFGHGADEMRGQDLSRLLPPGAWPHDPLADLPAALAAHPMGLHREMQWIERGGQPLPVQVHLAPVIGSDGHPGGATLIVRDQRAKARMAQAIADSESRFRGFSESLPVGVFATDERGSYTYTNPRWQSIFGLSFARSLGQGWAACLHAEDRAAVTAAWQDCVARGSEFDRECRILQPDGEMREVRIRARAQLGDDDRVLGFVGSLADISDRRRIERSLEAERNRLALIIQGTGAGTWEWNVQTGESTINERWAAMVGRRRDELGDNSVDAWRDLLHPDDLARTDTSLQRHFDGLADHYECESRMRHADGHWVWVLDRGRVMTRTADGRPEWMFGIQIDISTQVEQRQALEAAHEHMALATDSGSIGVWELEAGTRRLRWDDWMYRLYGVPEDSRPDAAQVWALTVHPDDRAGAEQAIRDALKGVRDVDTEFRIVWPDGSLRHLRSTARVTRGADGRALRLVGVNWDVTRLRQLSADLAEQHELMRVTLQSIGDAVITTDAAGQVTWLNPAAERMTGWPAREAQGRALSQVFHLLHEKSRLPAENAVEACLARGKVAGLAQQALLLSRDGQEFGIEDSAAPIRNEDGEVLGVVLVFRDVTEQRRLSGEMSYRATHDALTGLLNRAEFETRLRRALVSAQEEGCEHAMMYIDLDQFKLVNDACGHSAGDQLLQQVARLLGETVRAGDTLARLGGDEFAVILEHCTSEQGRRVAQIICDRMDEFRFAHDERRFRIGASIGLVPVDARWSTTAAVMQAADTSCYAAKEAGRNRVHVWFDTDLALRARQGEMQWATRLEQALDEDRFVLHAQRIFPLREAARGLHAEVLLRMRDTDGSLVQPGAFLSAAERFQMSARIDRWVLRRSIDLLRVQPDLTRIELLCINLSGQSIGDRAFHRQAIEILVEAGPDACRRLCLEITETTAITNMADAGLFIEQARDLGVRIALDDFGAGVSSFGYLKSLTVDLLKIDGQFVRDIVEDPLDDAAVRCFVDVAGVIGLRTVAEFVDRPEVLARLREIKVDYAQGFLLHRPEPIERVLAEAALPDLPLHALGMPLAAH